MVKNGPIYAKKVLRNSAIVLFLVAIILLLTLHQNEFFVSATQAPVCGSVVFSLQSPAAYQVYQRYGDKGNITIEGNVSDIHGEFQATYAGITTPLQSVTYQGTKFQAVLPSQSEGQGSFVLQWADGECTKTITVPYVGIGDVFLVAGQSNHTSVGINKHSYSNAVLKAALFGNDNQWKELADPFDSDNKQVDKVSADLSKGGSYIPYLATKIMALTQVPVAFVPAARGGSSMQQWARDEKNHLNRATLYGSAAYRAKKAGGVRAILWLQGETDVVAKMSTQTYKTKLITLANNFAQDVGDDVPLVAYQIGPVFGLDTSPIVTAIKQAAASSNHIILGPYLGDINLNSPAAALKVHFVTDEQQMQVAIRTFAVLQTTIFKVYKEGDINKDGKIDSRDYDLLVKNFLKAGQNIAGDINHSNKVDIYDYNILVKNYGK